MRSAVLISKVSTVELTPLLNECHLSQQAFQFSDKHGEVCPAKWKPGEKAIKPTKEGVSQYLASMTVKVSSAPGRW